MWSGVGITRRAQKRNDSSIGKPTPQQYKKRVALMLVTFVMASLASPFLFPYMGINLPFHLRVFCALVTCLIGIPIILLGARR